MTTPPRPLVRPKPSTDNPVPGFGQDAVELLQTRGFRFPAHIPIRSRDFNYIGECRFNYYLRRRLGLMSAFHVSDALELGSWFHAAFEALAASSNPNDISAHVRGIITKREREIREQAKILGVGPEMMLERIEGMKQDANTAYAWIRAAMQFKVASSPQLVNGFAAYFGDRNKWTMLGTELRLGMEDDGVTLLMDADQLIYNKETDKLWIIDAKTTAMSAVERAALIRVEPQAIHYVRIVQHLLDTGELRTRFKLPASTTLGGIMHLIVQKPKIQFSGSDRDFAWVASSKRSGLWMAGSPKTATEWVVRLHNFDGEKPTTPNKDPYTFKGDLDAFAAHAKEVVGTKIDKQFFGEPKINNYIARCLNWYNGAGDYAHERDDRLVSPPVVISEMPAAALLTPRRRYEYDSVMKVLRHYSTCPPYPYLFDRNPAGMTTFSGLSPLAEFYLRPVGDWPQLVKDNRFVQSFPDLD